MLAAIFTKRLHPSRFGVFNQCLTRSALERTYFNQLSIQFAAMATSSTVDKRKSKRVVLSKSITFIDNSVDNKKDNAKANRTLVLLFSWMLAQNKHLDKYNQFYANYDYDILIVNTRPWQLVLPSVGSVKNAEKILQFIQSKPIYSNLIVHGFSVGAYQFGEVLVKLSEDKGLAKKISPMFKAQIYDSVANLAAIPRGFSRALTSNPTLQKIIFSFLNFYLRFFWYIATKYYAASEREFYEMNHYNVPSLMLVSEADPVGDVESNQHVADSWIKRGVPIKIKVFKDSKHVSHHLKHPEEYEQEVRQLLEKAMNQTKGSKTDLMQSCIEQDNNKENEIIHANGNQVDLNSQDAKQEEIVCDDNSMELIELIQKNEEIKSELTRLKSFSWFFNQSRLAKLNENKLKIITLKDFIGLQDENRVSYISELLYN